MNNLRILIADQFMMVRAGLRTMLVNPRKYDIELFEARNSREVIELAFHERPDIILLDREIAYYDGKFVGRLLKENGLNTPILMFGNRANIYTVQHAVANDVDGFVLRDVTQEELIKAIRTLTDGSRYYCNEVAQFMLKLKRMEVTAHQQEISEREQKILALIAEDYCSKEIGEQLFLSSRTVEGYKKRLFSKLEVKSTVGLALYALRNGIIQ